MLLVGGCSSGVASVVSVVMVSMIIGSGALGAGLLCVWSKLILLMSCRRMCSYYDYVRYLYPLATSASTNLLTINLLIYSFTPFFLSTVSIGCFQFEAVYLE